MEVEGELNISNHKFVNRVTGMRYWTEEWKFEKCAVYAAT